MNLHIAIDPKNANAVYLAGDAYQTCEKEPPASLCTLKAFRVNYNPSSKSSTATSLTIEGTFDQDFLNANTVHSDLRAMAFDAAGNLILASDGGIYLRHNPLGNGTWQGLNGNLSVFEPNVTAFDANSKLLAVAAQDNGISLQSAPGKPLFEPINGGDGVNVAINDKTLARAGLSAIYSTTQELGGLSRIIINAQGEVVGPAFGASIECNGEKCDVFTNAKDNNFFAPFVLNRIDTTRIAIGGATDVYVTRDPLTRIKKAKTVNLVLTDLGTTAGPSIISYGTVGNPNALAVGASGISEQPEKDPSAGPTSATVSKGQVWFTPSSTAGSLTQLTYYAGGAPTGIVFDTRNQSRIFAADGSNLYYTREANLGADASFTKYSPISTPPQTPAPESTFPAGFTRPTAVEFISNNGVNALLVGGLNSPLRCSSAPNRCVLSPAQSPITVADSSSDGDLSPWRVFGRGLPNVLVDQMAYNPTVDVLSAALVGRGAWLLYDVTSNFPQATVLQFGLADNNSNPDPSLLTDGTVGSRPLIKYGTGALTISGHATYSGSTTINGGILELDGTISKTSSVAVNSTGILSGPGTIDTHVVTINAGGTLAPGATGVPGTSMRIVGNLAFQSGAIYLVQLNATTSSFADVRGTASLSGNALAVFAPGIMPAHQYTILQSAGLNGTRFGSLATDNLLNFAASLGYTGDTILLNTTAMLGAGAGLNVNQQNVVSALNNFFNGGGTLPSNFATVFGLSGPGLAYASSQLSGEGGTGAERAALQLGNEFLNLMLDPFVDGRLGSGVGDVSGRAMGFAPDERADLPSDIALAYAGVLKAPPTAPFEQRWTTWGASYGGGNWTNGNPTVGSNNLTAQTFGFATGMDYHYSPDTIFGFALGGGGTAWGLANGLGTGRSDAFQTGVYGITRSGPAYLAAALAFANHWMTTNRSALGDGLTANFDAQSYGARVEGGYRFATLPTLGVTPYAALQAQDFHTPSYSETNVVGSGFGLSYAAMNATDVRTELGARLDNPEVIGGMPLLLRARVAWAHDFVSNPSLGAAFQTLPGTNFVVNGAPLPQNSALTSAGAELFINPRLTLLAKFDGEFAPGSQTYAGSGTLRYSW